MNAKRLVGTSVIAAGLVISGLTTGIGTATAQPQPCNPQFCGGRETTGALATIQEARQAAGTGVLAVRAGRTTAARHRGITTPGGARRLPTRAGGVLTRADSTISRSTTTAIG